MKSDKTNGEVTLKQLKDEQTDQVIHLRKRIQDHEKEIKGLRQKLGEREEFAASIAAAVTSVDPFEPWKHKPCKDKSGVDAVIQFGDWHIGEYIRAAETEGFNRFDFNIAQARIGSIVNSFLCWIDVQRHAYNIENCHIFGLGDWVSGDIHPELMATNEFPLPEQTARAGLLLGEMTARISSHFKDVTLHCVGGDNHGRLTRKPQCKQKATNNMSYLVYAVARQYLRNCRNVAMDEAPGIKHLVNVNGKKFLIEHGDTVKSQMGIPFYGFSRATGREARRRMNTNHGFHYWSIGHFHVPSIIEGYMFVNGSLSGTSEFDHSCGRHAAPSQVAFLVHRKHGVFNHVPFQGD